MKSPILLLAIIGFPFLLSAQKDTTIYVGTTTPVTKENASKLYTIKSKKKYKLMRSYYKEEDRWLDTYEDKRFTYLNDSTIIIQFVIGKEVTSETKRIYSLSENKNYIIKDYDSKGTLTFSTISTMPIPVIPNGLTKHYYSDGSIYSEGIIMNNNFVGDFTCYHQNGVISSITSYKNNKRINKKSWNSDGIEVMNDVYSVVEVMPSFPGGIEMMWKFITSNIKYPELALTNKISGNVYVSFIVMEDGKLEEIKIIRGIGGGCDEVALRIISQMPIWIPGEHDGEKVKVQYLMPILFSLD